MDYRQFLFKNRSYTPIPVLILALIFSDATLYSLAGGFLIALSGELIRIWSIRYAGSATRTTGRVGADELVTSGPYARVRDPLYVGNFLIGTGFVIMAWPLMPWFLIGFIVLILFQYMSIIDLEQEFLREKFGQEYKAYEEHVPKFIPRLSEWKNEERQPTGLKKALRTERRTLQSFSAITLAIVLRYLLV